MAMDVIDRTCLLYTSLLSATHRERDNTEGEERSHDMNVGSSAQTPKQRGSTHSTNLVGKHRMFVREREGKRGKREREESINTILYTTIASLCIRTCM